MLSRRKLKAAFVTQANDASSIGNHRGMAHKAKRHSHKIMRQVLKQEMRNQSPCGECEPEQAMTTCRNGCVCRRERPNAMGNQL